MRWKRIWLLSLCWLLTGRPAAGVEPGGTGAGTTPGGEVGVSWDPAAPAQGDVVRLRVSPPPGARLLRGSLDGRPLSFGAGDEALPGRARETLVGIDAEQEPGPLELRLWIRPPEGRRELEARRSLPVRAAAFGKEELRLPDAKVRLSQESLDRVAREKAELDGLWPRCSPARLWEGAFQVPVRGRPGSSFGLRRWINGEPRSFHTGVDIKAPRGTPVLASNRGRVALVADHFFAGKSVFVDHGLGLYTMYFHLSEIAVEPGQNVERGDVLGRVGSTGRASGPHLHWGVRLGGARVDPEALIRITQQPQGPETQHEGEDEEGGQERSVL